MKKIISFFVYNSFFSTIVVIMILLIGLTGVLTIKKELLPEVDLPIVTIKTIYPGASPLDVEINVTNLIEESIESIDGIKETSSVSYESISLVTITLNDSLLNEEVSTTVQKIRDEISNITDFPKGVRDTPEIEKRQTNNRAILIAGLSSDTLTYKELRYEAYLLEKKIRKVAGVSKIEKKGYLDRQITLELIPEKVKEYQLDLKELTQAIKINNVHGSAGELLTDENTKFLVTRSQFEKPSDIGEVIIRSSLDGPLIRVKDFTRIYDTFEKQTVQARINGKDVIALNIYKYEDSDIVETAQKIKDLLNAESSKNRKDFSIIYSNDMSKYVSSAYRVVSSNAIAGFILVIIVLTLFMNFRISFWVALGIPISVFGGVAILSLSGYSLNVISLSSFILVLGIVVDDTIIISESIYRRWENGETPLKSAVNGTLMVFTPVLISFLTTAIAFAPMFFIPGNLGAFIFVIPLVIITTLFVSLTEGLIALPAHIAGTMVKNNTKRKLHSFTKVEKLFKRSLLLVLNNYKKAILAFFIILTATLYLSSKFLDIISFPNDGAETIKVTVELTPGTSFEKSASVLTEVEKYITQAAKNELDSFVTFVGEDANEMQKTNKAFTKINLTPYTERNRTAYQITDQLRNAYKKDPRFKSLSAVVQGAGPAPRKILSYKIIGSDDKTRLMAVAAIEKLLNNSQGVVDIENDYHQNFPQIELVFNNDKLARLALTLDDILNELRIALEGEVLTEVQFGNESVDYLLTLPQKYKNEYSLLEEFYISNSLGKLIRLTEVAELKHTDAVEAYHHYNDERTITIEADIDRTITTSNLINQQVRDLFDSFQQREISLEIKGEAESNRDSNSAFFKTFLLALAGIYLLLVLLFRSYFKPLLIIIVIPFGIIGVLAAFMLHNQPLTFMAMMGIIGLTGVVVNDALVLVDRLNREHYQNKNHEQLIDTILQGTIERFRPVVLTTITTAAGVLPLAYGFLGYDYVNAPMALALGWGLLFATAITLFLVPSLFMIYTKISNRIGR